MIKTRIIICAFLAITCVCFTSAKAEMLDLTGSGSGMEEINGAWFYNSDSASTGTGVIHSFVRLKGKDIEQGYNTDGRPLSYDENNSHTFTRSIYLGNVPTIQLDDGNYYREFLLDINQEDKDPLLSLDAFEIFMLTSNQYTGPVEGLGTIGDLIYTLDYSGTDNYILLDYSLNSGSGSGDMFAYIPNSLFLGYSDTDYVYLYSMFGATNGYANNAGFEEWAVRLIGETPPPPPVVPVPGAVILGMLGLTVAGVKLRKYA